MVGASCHWSRVYGLLRNVWDNPKMRETLYGPRMMDLKLPNSFDILEDLWPSNSDPVKSMMTYEFKNKMVNDLLWQEDRVSMAEGLEVRVPYLDTIFSSNILAMSRQELMPNGELKGYMKNMLVNIIPKPILKRPKSGFQVDSPMFVTQTLLPLVDKWLNPERIKYYGLFNHKFIAHILKQNPNKWLRWHFFMLYLMLTTHIWMAEFEKNQ
jgi:asparagine synthase (glutamine-hydrolysing)